MKKLISVFLLLCLLIGCAAADSIDLSSMTFDQLVDLQKSISAEIVKRPEWKEVSVPAGNYIIGEDIPAGTYSIEGADALAVIESTKPGSRMSEFYYMLDRGEVVGKVELTEGCSLRLNGAVIFRPPVSLGF